MTNSREYPFDDGFGPDILDRSSGKFIGGGSGAGHPYNIDPSYEDALHILEKSSEMPSPFVQQALTMDNPEAADLARRLTSLREAAGIEFESLAANVVDISSAELERENPTRIAVGPQVLDFIAVLQAHPVNIPKAKMLYEKIAASDEAIRLALESVCEHEGVKSVLSDNESQ